MIDRKFFFMKVRGSIFDGSLAQPQVNGCNALLDIWEQHYKQFDRRWLAYCLATAYHETAHTMQPIREYGRGKGRPYGRRVGKYRKAYYGRGYVQLTWLGNYRKAGKKLGVGEAFVKEPDKVMQPDIAARILYRGMINGWFTGKRLAQFITGKRRQYRTARTIVNGMDKASLIAGYAVRFEAALRDAPAGQKPATQPDNPPAQPKAPDEPKRRFWADLIGAIIGAFRKG